MITFKPYQNNPMKVSAVCYSGSLADAEELESLYKGKVFLQFSGIFTGCLMVEKLGGQRNLVTAGDYLIDSPDFGLFTLPPALFKKYYEALK